MKFSPDWGKIRKIKKMKSIFLEEKCIQITVLFRNYAFPSFFWCLKRDFFKNEVVLIIDVHFSMLLAILLACEI